MPGRLQVTLHERGGPEGVVGLDGNERQVELSTKGLGLVKMDGFDGHSEGTLGAGDA